MKFLLVATALLAAIGPAYALDAASEAVLAKLKTGKTVPIADVAVFMKGSERWCYAEDHGSCGWTDIYLDVTDTSAEYEGGALWQEDVEIAVVHNTVLRDNRYICELPENSAPTARALSLPDHSVIGGRALAALKREIAAADAADTSFDCFDYVLLSVSPDGENIVLRQRQYIDGATDAANDVEVTVHYDPTIAAALTLRW